MNHYQQANIYLTENKNATYKYSSTQFQVPKELSKKIMSFGKTIPNDSIYTDPKDPSYGRENDIHCTILYGIHDVEADNVKEALKDVKPFKAKLGKISYFSSDDYKVMKIEVLSKDAHKINKLLRKDLEFTNKFSDYNPHVTIAYVSKDFDEKSIDPKMFAGEEFDIDSLVFSSKDGWKKKIKLQ